MMQLIKKHSKQSVEKHRIQESRAEKLIRNPINYDENHKTTTKTLEEEAQLSFHEVKLYMINIIDNSHRSHRLTHPHLISISLKEQEDNLQGHNQNIFFLKERERFSSSFASCFSLFSKGYKNAKKAIAPWAACSAIKIAFLHSLILHSKGPTELYILRKYLKNFHRIFQIFNSINSFEWTIRYHNKMGPFARLRALSCSTAKPVMSKLCIFNNSNQCVLLH